MAIAVSRIVPHSSGDELIKNCTCALDNNYVTGGYSFDAASVGLTKINRFKTQSQGAYSFEYDYTNQKLKVFTVSSGTLQNGGAIVMGAADAQSMRIYYAVGIDFDIGDTVVDVGTLATGIVTNKVAGQYLELVGVLGAGPVLFAAGNVLNTVPPSAKNGTIQSPNGGAPGSESALYVLDFTNQTYPAVITGWPNGTAMTMVTGLGVPSTTVLRVQENVQTSFPEMEYVVNVAAPWHQVAIRNLVATVSGAAYSEVTNGTNLAAVNNIECEIWGF